MTKKAYRSSQFEPSKNSRRAKFSRLAIVSPSFDPDCPECRGTGWRHVVYRGHSAVTTCLCAGLRKSPKPITDSKMRAAGER